MKVVVVNKDGNMEEIDVNVDKLYTVCDYKTNKDFELLNQYDDYEIYGKRKGKIGHENSYFVEETYYGTICIVKQNDDLTMEEWSKYYTTLNRSDEKELMYESYESE